MGPNPRGEELTEPDVPLAGFHLVDHPGARVLARAEAVPWIRYVLEGGDTLYGAAERDRDGVELPGRAPVWIIPSKAPKEGPPAPSGVGAYWAVRHFRRGGRIFPALLGDRFIRFGTSRPFFEARVSEEARSRGIPTPRVLAGALYETRFLYRADLVTAFVPNSETLVETLFDIRRKGATGAAERLEALASAGALIRFMAREGLQHRDLNAGNVLLQWTGTRPSAHVLDLDRSRILPKGREVRVDPMLRRLRRSLRKWETRTGLRLSPREWSTLESSVMG